jgi:hypothetical protein
MHKDGAINGRRDPQIKMTMNTLIIIFETGFPALHRERLVRKIRSYPSWARVAANSFLIKTQFNPVQVRDQLIPLLRGQDKLFVGFCPVPSAWHGLAEDVSKWILENQPIA